MDELYSNIDNFYKDLVVKVLSESATSEDVEILKHWLSQSPDNMAYLKKMGHTWQITAVANKSSQYSAEETWSKVSSRLTDKDTINIQPRINYRTFLRVAAIWLFGFFLGGAAIYLVLKGNLQQSGNLASITEIVAPLGGKSQVTLPDGTVVWLNAGSKLRYAQSFNTNHRDVFLEGEAYFNVKTNPQKPFIVITSEMSVKAYGTAFNVKAYPDEGTITTTLIEGSVKIEGTGEASKPFEIELKPKQKFTYIKKAVAEKAASAPGSKAKYTDNTLSDLSGSNSQELIADIEKTYLYTSWKDDRWIIEREKLVNLGVMLERRYNVKFVYKSEDLKNFNISGIINKETLEQILDFLKLTSPLTYTIKDGVVTLELDKVRAARFSKEMQ